jgi:predicted transcriptional regulator
LDELALEVENRRRIFEVVCKFPGTHLRELSRALTLSVNLVDYHLLYLEKRELVFSLSDGPFKRYFPKDSIGADQKKDRISAPDKLLVGLLRQPVPFRIIILIAKNGTMTQRELAEALRKSPSTVSHHMDKLIGAGVVVKDPSASGYALSSPGKIERVLLAFAPHPDSLTDGFLTIWEDLHV